MCKQFMINSGDFISRKELRTQCKSLNINKKNTNFDFTITENSFINEPKTFLYLWPSISFAISNPFPYPYAFFLIFNGFFGTLNYDTIINFENFSEI